MKILVTGAAGFLGSHLVDRLLLDGNEVLGIDDFSTGSRKNIAHHRDEPRFSIRDYDVRKPFNFGGIEAVFHLACPASPVAYQADRVKTIETAFLGTRNALSCATAAGAALVMTSTSEVYGDPLESPQRETYWGNVNPVGPRSCYDEGKRAAETLAVDWASQNGTRVGIARLFNCYGPRMGKADGRLLPNLISQALSGEPLTVYGTGRQTRSLCFVSDTVDALVRLMIRTLNVPGSVAVVNIGNPDERSIESIAKDVARAVGGDVEYRALPQDDPKQRCPDITLARRMLEWEPRVSYAEGLSRTIEWFRNAA